MVISYSYKITHNYFILLVPSSYISDVAASETCKVDIQKYDKDLLLPSSYI